MTIQIDVKYNTARPIHCIQKEANALVYSTASTENYNKK